MITTTRHWLAASLAAGLLAAVTPGHAGSYSYTTITPANAIQPAIGGMNNNDQVVGVFQDPVTYVTHGFLWSQGHFIQIDLSPYGTTLTAINDSGIATGTYYPTAAAAQNFQSVGVVYNTVTGVMTKLPVRKGTTAYPSAINAAGVVTGTADVGYYQKAFIGTSSKLRTYSAPNAPYETFGVAINASQDVVIEAVDIYNDALAFVKHNDRLEQILPPDAVAVNAFGCGNNTGFITDTGVKGGAYGDQNGNVTGYTLSRGRYHRYNYPGAVQTTLSGVSPSGVIAGCAVTSSTYPAPTVGFVYLTKAYYPIQVPGAANTFVTAINANNSLAGTYNNQSTQGVFIAQCPTGQAPCTQ